jgi:eukaryotic-like serine/threonine-protein kinase
VAALTPERWREVSPYLDHALSLSDEDRVEWLAAFRIQRFDLADVLQELLDEHRALTRDRFLEDPPQRPTTDTYLIPGETIGPYKLVSRIGEGGMGHVWLAERADGRFERQVAVKFLRLALGSRGAERRFEREGKILGQLSHPNIAELVDAGITPNGAPYLILEYVKGQPIDAYCDERKLGVEARIELFLEVLGAVAQAHANLIVHRDIKPSNVFVSEANKVKLLDFGIAKLLTDDAAPAAATQVTVEGAGAMTPLFAAPEQITGGAITTATDVYALGVMLFLLLTGQHPAGPGPHSPADLVKAITETEPWQPSDVVAQEQGRSAAERRSSTPDKLRRQLRGDLDIISGKALKKNPRERYASVAALADDLRRSLGHEPIAARPDSALYRLGKYVRRHRSGVAVAALLFLLVVGFAVGQAVQLRRITRERDRANRITEFMTNMFKVSDPTQARGNNITAREILDKASKDIDTGLARDPELQAQMMNVMGDVYDDLGLFTASESLLRRAFEIRRAVLGPKHPDTLESKRLLGWALVEEDRYAEAESILRETVEDDRRALGTDHLETAASVSSLGSALYLEGRFEDAEKLHREAFEIARRLLGPSNPVTLSGMSNIATDLLWERRYPEAEKFGREALSIQLSALGPEHPATLETRRTLDMILGYEGRSAEAEALERENLNIETRVYGQEHPQTLHSMATLGLYIKRQGRYAEAEKVFRETLEIHRRVFGPDHINTAQCIYNLGCIVALRGNRKEALALVREAVDHGLVPNMDVRDIEQDQDLKSLWRDPRFEALIVYARKKAASKSTH